MFRSKCSHETLRIIIKKKKIGGWEGKREERGAQFAKVLGFQFTKYRKNNRWLESHEPVYTPLRSLSLYVPSVRRPRMDWSPWEPFTFHLAQELGTAPAPDYSEWNLHCNIDAQVVTARVHSTVCYGRGRGTDVNKHCKREEANLSTNLSTKTILFLKGFWKEDPLKSHVPNQPRFHMNSSTPCVRFQSVWPL